MFVFCNSTTFRRRESTDVEDLFIAHISGMDTLARGLCNVAKLIKVLWLSVCVFIYIIYPVIFFNCPMNICFPINNTIPFFSNSRMVLLLSLFANDMRVSIQKLGPR